MIGTLLSWLSRWERADVAIFHGFRRPPYGGSNQFLLALRGELRRRGLRVGANRIGPTTRACLLNAFAFDEDALRRQRRAGCRIVHRVDGPVDVYRGTDTGVDRRIAGINAEFADATVFQSRYSLEANRALGLSFAEPTIVVNAVDPALFHPRGRVAWDPERRVRLVSTSWSDNAHKGAATYRWLEQRLDWRRFEYTFVGRSPERFEKIRALPPLDSRRLGEVLRQHDIYVVASRHEPCSNAVLEALACGLPVLYLDSGSHGELVGEAGLPFAEPEQALAQLDRLVAEYAGHQARIRIASLAEVADRYLGVMGLAPPR